MNRQVPQQVTSTPKPPDIPHQIGVKVTTLQKPSLHSSPNYAIDSLLTNQSYADNNGSRIVTEQEKSQQSTPFSLNYIGLNEHLQFTTGKDFYVSEKFSFYVHYYNEGEFVLNTVILVAMVKDPGSRVLPLIDNSTTPTSTLAQNQSVDHLITFQVVEEGYHVLALTIQYTLPTGETRSLSKHFRFNIIKPLVAETTIVSAIPNGFLIKTEVSNVMPYQSILIDKIELIPSSQNLIAKRVTPTTTDNNTTESMDDIFEFPDSHFIRSQSTCDITWKFSMGETGKTSLTIPNTISSSRKTFSISLSNIPTEVKVKQAFSITITVSNCSTQIIRPRLHALKSKMSGILVSGLSGQLGNKLQPGKSFSFNVNLIAMELGLQTLHGLRITELEKDKVFDLNNLLSVMVTL